MKRKLTLLCTGLLAASAVNAEMTPAEMQLIDEGFRLFTEETWKGNGRTCATCHIPEKAYTISPGDIAAMTSAEKELVFARNVRGLENETLVEELALFNIDPDHFDDHVGPFRSTMTVAALESTTLLAIGPNPTIELGWAGDGSPNGGFHHGFADPAADGSIRAFCNGAIAQHHTASLERIPGQDFRLPTDAELDALEAFQNWLGRRAVVRPLDDPRPEFDLELLTFNDPRAESGKHLYLSDQASCQACHENGGAHLEPPPFLPGPPAPGANGNLDTNVDEEREFLSDLVGVEIPEDEGAPAAPGASNVQSIIESVRKTAFFHNTAETDLERAIEFYFREPFTSSPGRAALDIFAPGGHIDTLEEFEAFGGPHAINKMGVFMRTLFAYYALRDCERLLEESIARLDAGVSPDLPAQHCQFNLRDIRKALMESKMKPDPHRDIVVQTFFLDDRIESAIDSARRGPFVLILRDMRGMKDLIAQTTEEAM
jgi:mono/diheme cytochrome c family protein